MASDLNQVLDDGEYNHVSFYNGISIEETAGREGSDTQSAGTASVTYLLRGSADPVACRDALIDGPVQVATYDNKALETMERDRLGPESWQFTLTYNSIAPEIGGYTISIDTTGGQVLQTYGYNQTSFAATGQTATNYNNALDVQDGNAQGVQRVIPALKYSIRAKIATEYLGASVIAYSKLIARLTGCTNDGPMFGGEFATGELLFIGASGELVSKNPQLTFSFLASANVTDLTIGDIAGINKKGHEYLWFDFKRGKDSGTSRQNQLPRAAYVGQVYGEDDLGQLQIGTSPT